MFWFSKKPQPLRQRPKNVFRSAYDIALALMSDLADIQFGDVELGKSYATKGCGGFCSVTASEGQGQTTVDISGWYEFDGTKHKDDRLMKYGGCYFLIQIHCKPFQEGFNLRIDNKADFMDIYAKSIMLIDSLGFAERLNLDKVMYFNVIDTRGTPMENDPLFRAYSFSWHEAAKIALSEKTPSEKWKDFVAMVKQFCNLLDSGFKRSGLWEDKTMQECIREAH